MYFLYLLFIGDANKLKSADELNGQPNWSYVSTREYFLLHFPNLLLIFKELLLRTYENHYIHERYAVFQINKIIYIYEHFQEPSF